PLGVYRDKKSDRVIVPVPQKPVAEVLELDKEAAPVAPHHHAADISIKVAGFGGQGVLLLGILLAEMGMREGREVSWLPSYGPEMRSGSAHCHVRFSRERIGSPLISHPEVLIAMNEISLRKFAPSVAPGGLILYNRSELPQDFSAAQARVVCLPASEVADKLGSTKVANVIMLGALLEETECLSFETAMAVIEKMVKGKPELLKIDREALQAGRGFIDKEVRVGPVSQPDGFAY
ncbi:MAG TPA: 2-oxoacid:acceptor oxidoreductase family protein, partial [Terriglobales bacterium]|nr:2-oxoacid:acceptor oxidoreductase family protein [Terriglobales bacterium]